MVSRSDIFRKMMKEKAKQKQEKPTKPQKGRVGDRPFAGMKEDKNKGEER